MKKILIVHTAFIGDIILATPLIEAVKDRFADAQIDFVAIPATANLLETNPFLREVIVYDKKNRDKGFRRAAQLAQRLRRTAYDLAIVPHRSLRSALIVFSAGIRKRIGFDRSAGAFLFTERVRYNRDAHEVERNLALVGLSESEIKKYSPRIFLDESDKAGVDLFLEKFALAGKSAFVAMAPGSVWLTKRWTEDGFADVIHKLVESEDSLRVILIGGKQDGEVCRRLTDRFPDHVINTAGQFSLRQSAYLISRCRALICNDSGPMHLGVAVGTRVIAIFGPTVPAFGFAPYGDGHIVVEHPGLYCRPCHIHGPSKCPEKHFRCMKEISGDDVLRAVRAATGPVATNSLDSSR
ncbi:MAG: lipopolysaccharide heptosyltransferase II [Candidatus Zhuqueibacterota bacterium]